MQHKPSHNSVVNPNEAEQRAQTPTHQAVAANWPPQPTPKHQEAVMRLAEMLGFGVDSAQKVISEV
jgi:hypothetical protein